MWQSWGSFAEIGRSDTPCALISAVVCSSRRTHHVFEAALAKESDERLALRGRLTCFQNHHFGQLSWREEGEKASVCVASKLGDALLFLAALQLWLCVPLTEGREGLVRGRPPGSGPARERSLFFAQTASALARCFVVTATPWTCSVWLFDFGGLRRRPARLGKLARVACYVNRS
jgi:hypothetical protein